MRRVMATIGGVDVTLSVAETLEQKQIGFMFRESIGDDEGILFVNENGDLDSGFWMKNVKIPLSIAFIDKKGEIFEVTDLEPGDPSPIRPRMPFAYAIEMPRGWFDRNLTTARCNLPIR